MKQFWRKLDNTAKIFSLEGNKNKNTFRLSVVFKENIDVNILKLAVHKALEVCSSYKVKLKSGFFWNYLELNFKAPIIEEETDIPCKNINLRKNNGYLFKVTYFNNKLNLDIFHVLTDGVGSITFLKQIVYKYLDLKYNLTNENVDITFEKDNTKDQNVKNADKNLKLNIRNKKAFLIQDKYDLTINKTFHYIFDLKNFKKICKSNNSSITEYLTAIYIYALYKSIYNKSSNKDIIVTLPIDLRKHYNVESISNFFTLMNIEGNVTNKKKITFYQILKKVKEEFKNKLTSDNIKKYLARDVKLGTNMIVRLVPLEIKKFFISNFEKYINQSYTTTLSNIGAIKFTEKYKNYIDNVMVLVNAGKLQKVKCSICSYENNLTITINSNLVNNTFENKFYSLLKKYIGEFKLESNVI